MLRIWTATHHYPGPNALDITVKGQHTLGKHFAPTWDMVNSILKNKNLPPEQFAVFKAAYESDYCNLMQRSIINAPNVWGAVQAMGEVVFTCHCRYIPDIFCHRILLPQYFMQLGNAVYEGELVDFSPWLKKPNAISSFKGSYAWLSNFYPCEFIHQGIRYKSVEHFYQARKPDKDMTIQIDHPTADGEKLTVNAREYIAICENPKRAVRRYGIKPPEGWHDGLGDVVMRIGLEYKFVKDPYFRKLLMDTEGVHLIEGNTWHDNYWGDCKCVKCEHKIGRNKLGIEIMSIREMLCSQE